MNDEAQTQAHRERLLHQPSLCLTKQFCNSIFIPKQDRSCWYQQLTMILHLIVLLTLKGKAQTPAQREKYPDLLDYISINTNQIKVEVEASSFFSRATSTHHRLPGSASIGSVALSIV